MIGHRLYEHFRSPVISFMPVHRMNKKKPTLFKDTYVRLFSLNKRGRKRRRKGRKRRKGVGEKKEEEKSKSRETLKGATVSYQNV